MFKKLGKKNDFFGSYDVKRGQKSLKITENLKNCRQSQKFKFIFFFFKFIFYMKVIKIKFNKKKLLPSDEPEKTYKFLKVAKCLKITKKIGFFYRAQNLTGRFF